MAICPHCKKEISLQNEAGPDGRIIREGSGVMKKEVLYSCPHCRCVLGIGFFTGKWWIGRPK